MKKIFASLLFASALFLLFGCSQLLPQTKYVCADGTTVADSSLCQTTPLFAPPAAPPAAPTLTLDMEFEVCSGMPELQQMSYEELCISGLAAKHNNASFCKKLSYEAKKNCYLIVATAAEDPNVCGSAASGSDKNYCYSQYASNAKDASICEKITDINEKDNCYYKLSTELADPALCDKMKTGGQKNSCY